MQEDQGIMLATITADKIGYGAFKSKVMAKTGSNRHP